MEDIATKHEVPVIFYDQLGCGKSTHLPEKNGDEAFWTVELFLAELANLITKLGISSYSLLGHSWGGMLGAEHAVTKPKGLTKLVLSNSPASMPDWIKAGNGLKAGLPEDLQQNLTKCEEENRTDAKEYEAAVEVFYRKHLCRVSPWPQDLVDSMTALTKDPTVYYTM